MYIENYIGQENIVNGKEKKNLKININNKNDKNDTKKCC